MNRRELIAGAATLPSLALAQQANWKPLTFSVKQNETVVILTDFLIPETDTPGAKAANVNRYIDLLLTDGPEPQRKQFMEGLAAFDSFSSKSHGKAFQECSREQQIGVLKQAVDGTAPTDVVNFLRLAKAMTSRIYYNTEIGYRELNKGGRVPKSLACQV